VLLDISISRTQKKAPPDRPARGEVEIVRRFDDGLIEVKDHRGRHWRVSSIPCWKCTKPILASQASITFGRSVVCKPCWDEIQETRRLDLERAAQGRRMLVLENCQTSPQRRQAMIMLASPKWRDREAIKAIYAEAKQKTKETGIEHHVDHIYPIQGGMACGLHVHWNLQVMPAAENCSKNNSFPLDQSPAWDGCSLEQIEIEFTTMRLELEQLDKGRKSPPYVATS
jgi:hypothetical protein